jgi:WbqC-like protein family
MYVNISLYENYRKMSFRNRCFIAGAENIISLSIPLVHGRNQKIAMNEVLVSNLEDWQGRHWKSIQSAYARSPFFDYYKDELNDIFERPVTSLAEWNRFCLDWVMKKLKWDGEFLTLNEPITNNKTDVKWKAALPKNYMNFHPVKYRQVFEERTGFFQNLSILDLLFNTGNNAGELLFSVTEEI